MSIGLRYEVGELAELGGVTRRTVRFYVQEGPIPPSLGRGRGRHYTASHLQRLLRVKELQERGLALEAIRASSALGSAEGETGQGTPREQSPRTAAAWPGERCDLQALHR